MTVGQKIKFMRKLRGITQKELGFLVNLTDVRIRQYETDQRTPKDNQLQIIADSLGAPIEFFRDHTMDSLTDIMHILFELEDTMGISIQKCGDGQGSLQKYAIVFNNSSLNQNIGKWYEKKTALENQLSPTPESQYNYSLWKTRYPQSMLEDTSQKIHATRKALSQTDS